MQADFVIGLQKGLEDRRNDTLTCIARALKSEIVGKILREKIKHIRVILRREGVNV